MLRPANLQTDDNSFPHTVLIQVGRCAAIL
jgi:hypothetical protein